MGKRLAVFVTLCASWGVDAITKEQGVDALKKIEHLKGIDGSDLACDACLLEVDCIWPCELMCLLDLSEEYVGQQCPICLEYFGCEGCKLLCPSETTLSPSPGPTTRPTTSPTFPVTPVPTTGPTAYPVPRPTLKPTGAPTFGPTKAPLSKPTHHPTHFPTLKPTKAPYPVPTPKPTSVPSTGPTPRPTHKPTPKPSGSPTTYPTTSPNPAPSYAPTPKPSTTPSPAPTPVPEFFIYYTTDAKYLYAYNYNTGKSTFMVSDSFDGDLKVDQPNRFLFWSASSTGKLNRYDLDSDTVDTILTDDAGIMGIDTDASVGMLYYVNQAASTLCAVSYSGGNFTVMYTFADMVPYGLTIEPFDSDDNPDDDMDKDGLFLATASNDEHGYIVRGYLAAGDEPEVIYTTSYTDIFGILYNAQTDMMYWIEERGFANGIYVRKMDMKYGCDDDNECAEQFLQLLEKAYWVAAIWDIEMMFACDYANSKVFAFTMNNDGSFGDEVSLVSPEANPRCIGYYYGYDIDTPGAFDFGGQTKRALAAKAAEADAAADSRSLVSVLGASTALVALVAGVAVAARRHLASVPSSVDSNL